MEISWQKVKQAPGWTFSIFFLVIGVFGTLLGDVHEGFGTVVMGLALLPKIQKIGSLKVNWWMRAITFFVGAVIVGTGNSTTDQNVSEVPKNEPTAIIEESSPPATENRSQEQEEPIAPQLTTFLVTTVIDGDTIKVKMPDGKVESVRIIGIDAPESGACFESESTAKMASLTQGKEAALEAGDSDDRDRYGRLLRYVRIIGEDIGAVMVREGFAESYRKYPHSRSSIYNAMEESAKLEKKGLWGGCTTVTDTTPSTTTAPVPNVVTTPTPQTEPSPQAAPPLNTPEPSTDTSGSCNVKGNINSKGAKLYHFPGCPSYNATKINKPGERCFNSTAEAQAAGWVKAGNCP